MPKAAMPRFTRFRSFLVLSICWIVSGALHVLPAQTPVGQVLILFEGSDVPANIARGDARELAMLLGHFPAVSVRLQGLDAYQSGGVNAVDMTFFIGYSKRFDPPDRFMHDVYTTSKRVVWMNTGMERFARGYDLTARFGLSFVRFDTVSNFDEVKAGSRTYTKGEPNLNIVSLAGNVKTEILAMARSTATGREAPYCLRSSNFVYIGDSPFSSATETDRYIWFADWLHDLLGIQHEEIHRALVRIEDVDLFENPTRLRDIADLFWSKHVPFLVGVIPFFVDPASGIRLSMSEKPEFVDAIHYMVAHGATIVMHGITHQYEGVTAIDYEFWDGAMNRKIRNDSREYVERKMRTGLEECWKNDIYPLVWETPHYTASQTDYPVFGEFFSTCMEQRLVIDNIDYSQYFPYIIERDLYGQRIIPENLGYIPHDEDDPHSEENAVKSLLKGAEAQLGVRDGFASAFIHPFIDLKYMEEYVDGVLDLGYTFMDVKNEPCRVQVRDRVAMTGEGTVQLVLEDQYLRETWLRPDGKVDHWEISPDRIHDTLRKSVQVPPGEIYVMEPSEYRVEAELSFMQKLQEQAKALWNGLFESDETFAEARVAIVWDPKLKGSGWNDQASFASAFRSLNIPVDTLAGDSIPDISGANVLVVPYPSVERLSNSDYDRIVEFAENGGNVITDGRNGLAEELGITFASSSIKIERMRDRLYPEDALVLALPDIMARFEVQRDDEVLAIDERTEAPVAVGRKIKRGKLIYLGIRFDPVSTGGYSRFPYLLEYVRSFLKVQPILRRESLEVYFDDGYRHNVSIEDLVKRWVVDGIRAVHVVGWHQYESWSYDYERLIRLCHANGILVYAWLDPPQVSEKFWKDHPQWQELNYKGEAIRPSWRYPVALTSPECLVTVKGVFEDFLRKYDWDGVNLAELYFDAGNGVRDPRLMTPMHPSAREEFTNIYCFDPALIFDPQSSYFWKRNPAALKKYEDYRVGVLTRLHEEFLSMIDGVRASKNGFDVVVTAMDDLGSPELRANNGVDALAIMALQDRHPFTLQIEDPQSEWSRDPRRYHQLARRYDTLAPGRPPVMVDLNILQFRDEKKPTPFPTLIQTGIESYQLVQSAARGADRFVLYSESSIRPQDLRMMSYAASTRALLEDIPGGWRIRAPFPVTLELPSAYTALRTADGSRIVPEQGKFFLPPGEHMLIAELGPGTPFSSTPGGGRLLSITGTLTGLSASNRSVTFSYRSTTRCIASFSHRPFTLFVDGKEFPAEPLQGYRRYSVILPPGEHDVIAVLETTVSYGVDLTSFWSSWLIVGFGMLSGAALLTFYTMVRVSRPKETRR